MKRFVNTMSAVLFAASGLLAQNSDLGILIGAANAESKIQNGVVQSDVTGGFQVNYAWQLVEGHGGRLYVELPLQIIGRSTGKVGRGVTGETTANIFLTPGLRYQYNVAPRVGLYAAAGVGFALKAEERSFVGNSVVSEVKTNTGGAFNFGGGIDFRLTRLWSLRGEVRSFRTTKAASLGARTVIGQFGFALHF